VPSAPAPKLGTLDTTFIFLPFIMRALEAAC